MYVCVLKHAVGNTGGVIARSMSTKRQLIVPSILCGAIQTIPPLLLLLLRRALIPPPDLLLDTAYSACFRAWEEAPLKERLMMDWSLRVTPSPEELIWPAQTAQHRRAQNMHETRRKYLQSLL